MSAHLIAEDTATTTALDATADPAWCGLSAALTDEVPTIADREDLIVTVAPGAGHGSPACFLPALATIELDGTHLDGIDPATAAPHRIGDRARYAPAWGLLTHECAHARHTAWQPPPEASPRALDAAMLLEESRIEAAQIRRRPDDRHWLRASATALILAETRADDPTHAPKMTPWHAGCAAALLLARVDAGILTATETAPVAHAVETVLGAATLAGLRALWQTAHTLADDDAAGMIDLGRRWCDTLATDPDTPPTPTPPEPTPGPSATPPTTSDAPHGPDGPADAPASSPVSPLAEAITETLGSVAAAVATEPVPADPARLAAEARAAEADARDAATTAARRVFTRAATRTAGHGGTRGGTRTGSTAIAGTRPASDAERAAARALARALSTAGVRDRAATKTTSVTPPGRLRMRGALAADAQRAARALPTAEPFTRTTRRTVPAPPLRLGIACDVSGSMAAYAAPVASAAWILAHAAYHAQVEASSATVIFGRHVRAITAPGAVPREVTEFDANDGIEDIAGAIDALDGALALSQPGAARLLVIVSDGHYRADPRRDGQTRITRLRATGCGVLWLAPNPGATPLDGATVHCLADPASTAQAIGRAATTALRSH